MGIITETPGSATEWTGLDTIELVRAKAGRTDSATNQPTEIKSIQTRVPTISSGSRSLTLRDRCVIYRNIVSRQPVTTIIPLRSIESFVVQRIKPKWLRFVAIFLLLASVLSGLGTSLILGKKVIGQLSNFWAPDHALVWIPFAFLLLGIVALVAHSRHSQTELVIYNRSGNNQVRLPLAGKMKNAVEQFVTAIESQMGEL